MQANNHGGAIPFIWGACLAVAAGAADTLEAEVSGAETDSEVVYEILVTARKREESLLEIPESVTAISGDDINRRNLKGLEDIGFQVPNLNLSTRLDGFPNVSIRGLGSFGNTQGVGFYLDDVQLFSDASSRFGDLQRIEILKGPQGTLYGGSNIGGAVKFVAARPDPESVFGRIKGVAGEQGILDVEGSLNLPLGDGGWAARLFGFGVTNDGYLKNRNSPRVNGLRNDNDSDVGASEEFGVRASLAGPLGDQLSAYLALRYNDFEGPNNTWIRELDPLDLGHPNIVDTTTNPRHERQTFSGMLELTWNTEAVDVLSMTSYTDTDSDRYTDLDIREEYLLDLFRPERMEVFTQELRFTSAAEGPAQWLGGLYYSKFSETMDADLIWFDTRALPGGLFSGPLGCAAELPTCSGVWAGEIIPLSQELDTLRTPFEKRERNKSHLAAFGNFTYEADGWEWGLGLRIDRWRNATDNLDTGLSSKQSGTEVLPRASASRWLGENAMLYATIAWGYEPGGYNLNNIEGESDLLGFDAERATNYEIGWKGRWANGRGTASIAGFFIDYRKRQIEYQVDSPAGVVEGIVNLGDSRQYGLEAELSVQVSEALRLALAAGLVEAKWKSGAIAEGRDLKGSRPPVVPDFSWNAAADFRRPIGNGMDFLAGAQLSSNGAYDGLLAWNPVRNPRYTLVSAQVGFAGENWELMLNGENLLDKKYYTDVQHFPNYHGLDGGDFIVIGTLGQPRLLTASLSFFF